MRKQEHHAVLPPSSFPKLQKCYHFTSSGGTGGAESGTGDSQNGTPYTERGTRIDELVVSMLDTGIKRRDDQSLYAPDEWDCAKWIASETSGLIYDIRGLQTKIEIDDPVTGEPITFGTCDVWGYSGEQLTLADFKSGLCRDYMAQLAVYALGLMDREKKDSCRAYCVFGDQKQVEEYRFTMGFCEALLADTIAGINNPDSPYNRNNYCEWCSLRPRCPAWLAPASLALSAIKPELGVQLREGLDLLSPQQLADWYGMWLDAEKLVKDHDVRGKLLQLVSTTDIEGWMIQARKGARHYAKNSIYELITSSATPEEVAACLRIVPEELDKLLKKYPGLNIPPPFVSPGIKALVRTNNNKRKP